MQWNRPRKLSIKSMPQGVALLAFMTIAIMHTMLPQAASAQQSPPVDIQNFQPGVGPHAIVTTQTSDVLGHLTPAGMLLMDYLSEPLVLAYDDGTFDPVIERQLAAHMVLAMGLWDVAQINLNVPLYLVNMGQFGAQPIQGASMGDMHLGGIYQLLSNKEHVVGIAAGLDIRLPTGNAEAFVGSSTFGITPKILIDSRLSTGVGALLVAANLGFDIKETQAVHNLDIGPGVLYNLGAELEVVQDLFAVSAELYGRMHIGDALFTRAGTPLEAVVGAKLYAAQGLSIMLGTGGGLVGGVGAPAFRTFLGISYTHPNSLVAASNATADYHPCPNIPENYDGPLDDEGCPLLVGKPDGEPAPVCEHDIDGHEGEVDEYGCPIIEENDDANEPVETDATTADDDVNKHCPDMPEDYTGPKDENGCPASDRDHDRIIDALDECPDEPGLSQYNGCPPPQPKAIREQDEIKILENVFFETEKAVIVADSYDLLDQVGLVLRNNPDIRLIEIAGHTDQRGDAMYNQMLSEERAKAVRQYLIDRAGIAAERLVAEGYGPSKPLVEGDDDEAMAKNRRVEFNILEQDSSPHE